MTSPRIVASLTAPATPLIGREDEIARVSALLAEPAVRLVTIAGPGGAGKTRLALAVAGEIAARYPGGVAMLGLADVTTPERAIEEIAALYGAPPREDAAPLARAAAAIPQERSLLLLDNLEQIPGLAAPIATLIGAVPALTMLVTSRSPLRIRGEREFVLGPLPLPDPALWRDPAALASNPAVRLFVDRAEAVRPSFALDRESAPAVAEMCARLDGLPLAIELAAARIRLLPPAALLPRLADSLALLTGGPRDLPVRQQTLRGAIAWSFDMLHAEEQALFRRLGVFRRGAELGAVEAIAAVAPAIADPFSALESLVDQSLLQQDDRDAGEPRYRMLETIRAYAFEQLTASPEATAIRDAHALWAAELAAAFNANVGGPEQRQWLTRLDIEAENLRAALDWSIEGGQFERAQTMCHDLLRWWDARGKVKEAREWLARALANGPIESSTGVRALATAAIFARRQDDFAEAERLYAQSLEISTALGDRVGIASAINNLGVLARDRDDLETAFANVQQALAIFRELEDERRVAAILINIGGLARRLGRFDEALAFYQESLALYRRLADRQRAAVIVNNLGVLAMYRADYARAKPLFEEALKEFTELEDQPGIALATKNCGEVYLELGDNPRAIAAYKAALHYYAEIGGRREAIECVEGIAMTLIASHDGEAGARLLGAADFFRGVYSIPVEPEDRKRIDHSLAQARGELSRSAVNTAFELGKTLDLDATIREAMSASAAPSLSAPSSTPAAIPTVEPLPNGAIHLTKREREVLRLLSQGKSDKEIGDELFISPRTAMTHVANLLGKLDVPSRTAAAAAALRYGLV
jgi:predicted ATPase/DNA-binding CsgD family transcriptional regulator